jgi:hypothetical protein
MMILHSLRDGIWNLEKKTQRSGRDVLGYTYTVSAVSAGSEHPLGTKAIDAIHVSTSGSTMGVTWYMIHTFTLVHLIDPANVVLHEDKMQSVKRCRSVEEIPECGE